MGLFLFLRFDRSTEALGVSLMLGAAVCFIVWIVLSALEPDESAATGSLALGAVMGLIGLIFLSAFPLGTNGGLLGLIATSFGALFFVGGLAILRLARQAWGSSDESDRPKI